MKTHTRASIGLACLASLALLGAACRASSGGDAADGADAQAASARYHCPMHPTYTSDHQGDCPICGMKLVAIQAGEERASGSGVPERSVVALTTERRQMLGVRTEELRVADLAHEIRTVGRVAADERRLHHVHTKFEAYVEHLHVDFTGKRVERGEPLLQLFEVA